MKISWNGILPVAFATALLACGTDPSSEGVQSASAKSGEAACGSVYGTACWQPYVDAINDCSTQYADDSEANNCCTAAANHVLRQCTTSQLDCDTGFDDSDPTQYGCAADWSVPSEPECGDLSTTACWPAYQSSVSACQSQYANDASALNCCSADANHVLKQCAASQLDCVDSFDDSDPTQYGCAADWSVPATPACVSDSDCANPPDACSVGTCTSGTCSYAEIQPQASPASCQTGSGFTLADDGPVNGICVISIYYCSTTGPVAQSSPGGNYDNQVSNPGGCDYNNCSGTSCQENFCAPSN